MLAARSARKRRNVQAATALADIADWVEANCYDADKVTNPEKPLGSPLIRLTVNQKRILRKCFTIDPRTGRFPYPYCRILGAEKER